VLGFCTNWTPVTSFGPRAFVKDARPEEASRVDRPVPVLSGRFRPCRKRFISGIRPPPFLPLDSSKSFLQHLGAPLRKDRRDAGAHSRRWKRAYSAQFWWNISPLTATLMDLPASVANKRLTSRLNPLDATFTKIRGVGVRISLCFLTSFFQVIFSGGALLDVN